MLKISKKADLKPVAIDSSYKVEKEEDLKVKVIL